MNHIDALESRQDRTRTMMEKMSIVADIERRKREEGVSFRFSALKYHDISRRTWERYRGEVQEYLLRIQPELPFAMGRGDRK